MPKLRSQSRDTAGRDTRNPAVRHAAPASEGQKVHAHQATSPGKRASPSPTRQRRGGKKARSVRTLRAHSCQVNGEEFELGCDAYVALANFQPGDDEDEDEACEVCGSTRLLTGMLECSCCLRGFHLRCLKPPLKAIPEGDWLCASCDKGEPPPPPQRLATAWQRALYGAEVMGVARVEGFASGRCPQGEHEEQVRLRFYCRPEDTHVGRQRHHGARELFLTTKVFCEPVECLVRRAFVHAPARFAEGAEREDEGNDVFVCEYEYDEGWRRFRRRAGCGAGDDSDWDGAVSSDGGSDEDAEAAYAPERRTWAGRGRGGARRRGHGALGRDTLALHGLGSECVPDAARQPLADPCAEAVGRLALGVVPAALPCREAEQAQVRSFVATAIEGGDAGSGVLYVCGVPGTGKTASVMAVLRELRPQAQAASTAVVVVNCLQLPSPQHVFSRLWERLSGERMGPARARAALDLWLQAGGEVGSRRRRGSTILLLDEIDMLLTRDQAVLYTLFEWPSRSESRLAVIGISNTHDLEQRVAQRIASRLSSSKLVFQPYSVAQLGSILRARLQGCTVVDGAAIDLAARNVAASSGDVRRALQLLRRAVEMCQEERRVSAAVAAATAADASLPGARAGRSNARASVAGGGATAVAGTPRLDVGRAHVTRATNEMFHAVHMQLLRGLALWERLLLVALTVEARAAQRAVVGLQGVLERLSSQICGLVGTVMPSTGAMQRVAARLAAARVLLMDSASIKARVALNVAKDDVALVIRDDERLSRLHQLM